jgi:hypothetical protein
MSRFFSITVKGTPAAFNLIAAHRPDKDFEAGGWRGVTDVDVAGDDAELLGKQGTVDPWDVFGERHSQHVSHLVGAQFDGLQQLGLMAQHGISSGGSNLGLDGIGKPTGIVVVESNGVPRCVPRFEPPIVTGEMHQHHQQRGNVGFLQGVPERVGRDLRAWSVL